MIIIGLTGKNASGKGEVATYLKSKGFSYFSLSDAIRDELLSQNIEETRENLIKAGNSLRNTYGPGILAKRISKKVIKDTIIDSIRNPNEVSELRKFDEFRLITVAAPMELRFERAMARGRNESASTLQEFKKIEEKENSDNPNAQQLNATIELSDYVIKNDGDLAQLHQEVDKMLESLHK